jgi:hypothetical protein
VPGDRRRPRREPLEASVLLEAVRDERYTRGGVRPAVVELGGPRVDVRVLRIGRHERNGVNGVLGREAERLQLALRSVEGVQAASIVEHASAHVRHATPHQRHRDVVVPGSDRRRDGGDRAPAADRRAYRDQERGVPVDAQPAAEEGADAIALLGSMGIGAQDAEAVRGEEPPKRLRVEVDLQRAGDERHHLGLRAPRMLDQILGDRARVLRVHLRLPVSPELGPYRVEHLVHRQRPHRAHGPVGAPHSRPDLSRGQTHACVQQEERRRAQQDRLGRDDGHESHRRFQQDPLRSRRPLQDVRMLALPTSPRIFRSLARLYRRRIGRHGPLPASKHQMSGHEVRVS